MILLYVLIVPLAFFVIIAIAGAVPVFSFDRIKVTQEPDHIAFDALNAICDSSPLLDDDSIELVGFEPLGVFTAHGLPGEPTIVVWEQSGEFTLLCGYLLPNGICQMDLVTMIDGMMVTTGTSKDGQLFPGPATGHVQTFSVMQFSELMEKHQAGVEYLCSVMKASVDLEREDFCEHIETAIKEQGKFIRSIPFWIARIPWWYLIRRNIRHNRTIESLYGASLPNYRGHSQQR